MAGGSRGRKRRGREKKAGEENRSGGGVESIVIAWINEQNNNTQERL